MAILSELRAHAAGATPAADDADIIWHHPAFCAFALPAAPDGAAAWQRELGGTSVIIEPGGERLPGGALLRRLLMHLCDTALRTGQAQVMLGADAATLLCRIEGLAAVLPSQTRLSG